MFRDQLFLEDVKALKRAFGDEVVVKTCCLTLRVIAVWASRAIRRVELVLTCHQLALQIFHLVCPLAGIFIEHVAGAFDGAEAEPDVVSEGATIIPPCSVVSLLQTIEFVVQQDNYLACSLEFLVGLMNPVDDVTRLLVVGCVVHVVCSVVGTKKQWWFQYLAAFLIADTAARSCDIWWRCSKWQTVGDSLLTFTPVPALSVAHRGVKYWARCQAMWQ